MSNEGPRTFIPGILNVDLLSAAEIMIEFCCATPNGGSRNLFSVELLATAAEVTAEVIMAVRAMAESCDWLFDAAFRTPN